ncbi:MAG: polyamine aminopropyltransferase [Verrucomicrobiota bacterium]|nr:polyamine aminopropyltransferase [Verrucomicrobiota bacterium]
MAQIVQTFSFIRYLVLSVICLCVSQAWSGERYLETLFSPYGQSFEISSIVHEEKSAEWDLLIFDNPVFGRVLAIDGTIQLTEKDEPIYHEMMAHVPLLAHESPRSVLIVGGGDGGLLREVLRHSQVQRVVLVEIDKSVITLSQQFFPALSNHAFEDPRVSLVIQDAAQYMKETQEQFDIILCDVTDPIGPAAALFTKEFYGDCKKRLNVDGILVNQNGVPFLQPEEYSLTKQNRSPHFAYTTYYTVAVPTYVGGNMALGWASDKKYRPTLSALRKRKAQLKGPMKYYTPEIHKASFVLPQFMLEEVYSNAPSGLTQQKPLS